MTKLFLSKGDDLAFGAGWAPSNGWQTDHGRIHVVEDAASKYGHAIEKVGIAGDKDGWLGALNVARKVFNVRELYIRMVWAVSDNWQFHSSGYDKLFLWGRFVNGGSPTQFVITQGGPGVRFTNQAAGRGGASKANQGTFQDKSLPRISPGVYHTVEVFHVLNTPGQKNGSIRVWLDDQEAKFTPMSRRASADALSAAEWVEWDENKFDGIQVYLYWGGGADMKNVNDWIRLSEFYLSGR